MIDHVAALRAFPAPFMDMSLFTAGLEDCEGPFSHRRKRKTITKKYLARHFMEVRQALDNGVLDNVCWLPGPENLAGALAKVECDMVPLLRMLQSGSGCPGALRPLRCAALAETAIP